MGQNLLKPIQVGTMSLKNRIMFPPLTTGYEERDGSIGARSLGFYERLAKGGVSYIVIGDVAPVRTASPTPRLYDDSQIPAFQKLADALHAHGSKLALQIFHPEYDVPGVSRLMIEAGNARRAAAQAQADGKTEEFERQSALAEKTTREAYAKLRHDMQHFVNEATKQQLADIRESIAQCAARAQQAGADAVEVHGDRLLGSLCSTLLNHRTDCYGGSFENRIAYALEVVAAIRAAAPKLAVEYKLPLITVNADGSMRGKGGLFEEDAVAFAKRLEQAGVDMIQVAQANHTGNMGDTIPPMGDVAYNWTLPFAKKVKDAVNIPVATVGRVITVEAGEQILANGEADMIGYGRSLLTDPDIAVKTAAGECIRECLNCNKGCVDAIQNRRYISCVLNAENGDETTIFLKPADAVKKVAIVGAGLAGLEAARVAAKRGHEVVLFEKSDRIGGQIHLAAAPPRKSEILRAVAYYEKLLPEMRQAGLNIHLRLHTEPSAEELNSFDHLIVAVGAHNMELPIPAENSRIVSSWDVLNGAEVSGACAVLGGGLVGTETAEYLAERGHAVTIIEMADQIAAGESPTVLPLIRKSFQAHHVTEYVNTKVTHIQDNVIHAIRTETDTDMAETTITLAADTIVNALGSKKNVFDETGITTPVTYVGDCSGEHTADIASAIRSGYHAANQI